jgi:hypothetical protein
VTVRGTVDFEVRATGDKGVFDVSVAPRDVSALTVKLGGLDARIGDVLEPLVADELRKTLIANLAPAELGTYGSSDAPLRALRVAAARDGGVWVEMLSWSPSPGVLSVRDRPLADGFAVYASVDSVVDLARREAFLAPPLTHEVVAEPTGLAVAGHDFNLALRLWRPVEGTGWWRDYVVAGTVGVGPKNRRVLLTASGVTEGAASEGAELVDPLATLAEGVILQSIADAANLSAPAASHASSSGVRVETQVIDVSGDGDVLTLVGTVDVQSRGATRSRPR